MFQRLTAVFALGSLAALGAAPAAAVSAPKPAATASPLKTITHIHVSPLCSGLRRNIGPAIAKVLQNDKIIASSKPLFHSYARDSATGLNKGAADLAVSRMESLVGPLVKNTEAVDRLLNDRYAFPKVAYSDEDQKLLQMRAQLEVVNAQQKRVLDIINGFVDTQQLGELQAAGHHYDAALSSNPKNVGQTPQPSPTQPPDAILNAGVDTTSNDPIKAVDPRYKNTGSIVGANPLDAFERAISDYQHVIQSKEQVAAKSVIQAVPLCGGRVPGAPAPQASP